MITALAALAFILAEGGALLFVLTRPSNRRQEPPLPWPPIKHDGPAADTLIDLQPVGLPPIRIAPYVQAAERAA